MSKLQIAKEALEKALPIIEQLLRDEQRNDTYEQTIFYQNRSIEVKKIREALSQLKDEPAQPSGYDNKAVEDAKQLVTGLNRIKHNTTLFMDSMMDDNRQAIWGAIDFITRFATQPTSKEEPSFPFSKNKGGKWFYSYKDSNGLNQHSRLFDSEDECIQSYSELRMSNPEPDKKYSETDLVFAYQAGENAADFDRKRKDRIGLKESFFKTKWNINLPKNEAFKV